MANGIVTVETPADGSRPTFVIGGVGHRDLGDNEARIREAILGTLKELLNEHSFSEVSLLTSVADGADRLLLQAAVSLEMPVHCVLPCPPTCFREDFRTEASREEFDHFLSLAETISMPPAPMSKEDGYLWASEAVLNGCDVLVAVWDGNPGKGRAGTESTLARARMRAIPAIWIHSEALDGAVLLDPLAL